MSRRWLLFGEIYASIQANTLLFYLGKLPVLSGFITPKTYKKRLLKYTAGVVGILVDFIKGAISGNLLVLFAVKILPDFFQNAGLLTYNAVNASPLMFLLIVCMVPAILQSTIFSPSLEDHTFLNHFMINPAQYYQYKTIKGLFWSSLLLLPSMIYIFKNVFVICVMLFAKQCFIVIGNIGFLLVYKKKHRAINKKTRLLVCFGLVVLAYGQLFFNQFRPIVIGPETSLFIIMIIILVMSFCFRYFFSFDEYKEIAIQYANKDNIMLKIAISTSLTSEDELSYSDSNIKVNQEYFITHHKDDMWKYFDKVFRKRFHKLIKDFYQQAILLNLLLGVIVGVLIRFDILKINAINVLEYATMLIPVIMNMTFGKSYLQMCFRYMDMPLMYHHMYNAQTVKRSIQNRYQFLALNGLLTMFSLIFGILMLCMIGKIQISIIDFVKLCVVYYLIFLIFETYHVIVYYLLQPYSTDMSVKNPVFSVLSVLEIAFFFVVLFSRKNIVMLVNPLTFTLFASFVVLMFTVIVSPKTLKLRK